MTTTTMTYKMDISQFPIHELLKIVSELLEAMLATNNQIPCRQITYFHSRAVPNITVLSYLTRIYKFAPFTNEALLSILIYFDAIAKLENGININSYNIHRLLITSIVVASKFTSDIFYANSRYAKVGGIPLRELNQLEMEFLFLIDFQLYIKLEHIQDYADQLLHHHAMTATTRTTITKKAPFIVMPPLTVSSSSLSMTTTTNKNSIQFINNTEPIIASSSLSSSPSTNITLPLTPPYNNTTILDTSQPRKKKRKQFPHHPYQQQQSNNTITRKRLGLVSPKEE